jgi:hypothetical protein
MTKGRKITDAKKKVKDLDPKGRAKDVKGGALVGKQSKRARDLVIDVLDTARGRE